MSVNLREVELQCPECGNRDKSKLRVFREEWFDIATNQPVYNLEPDVAPTPAESEDTIECQAIITDEAAPCGFRGAVNDYFLQAEGVQISPIPNPEVHGEPDRGTPPAEELPAGGDAAAGGKKKKGG